MTLTPYQREQLRLINAAQLKAQLAVGTHEESWLRFLADWLLEQYLAVWPHTK